MIFRERLANDTGEYNLIFTMNAKRYCCGSTGLRTLRGMQLID